MALPLQANELPPDLRMNGAASHALHQGVDVGEYMTVADDPDRCASRGAGRLPLESAAQQKSQKHLCSRTVVMLRISARRSRMGRRLILWFRRTRISGSAYHHQ